MVNSGRMADSPVFRSIGQPKLVASPLAAQVRDDAAKIPRDSSADVYWYSLGTRYPFHPFFSLLFGNCLGPTMPGSFV